MRSPSSLSQPWRAEPATKGSSDSAGKRRAGGKKAGGGSGGFDARKPASLRMERRLIPTYGNWCIAHGCISPDHTHVSLPCATQSSEYSRIAPITVKWTSLGAAPWHPAVRPFPISRTPCFFAGAGGAPGRIDHKENAAAGAGDATGTSTGIRTDTRRPSRPVPRADPMEYVQARQKAMARARELREARDLRN